MKRHLFQPDGVFMLYGVMTSKQATVTYYLLLDSQRSHNRDDYLESDFEELVSSRFLIDRE